MLCWFGFRFWYGDQICTHNEVEYEKKETNQVKSYLNREKDFKAMSIFLRRSFLHVEISPAELELFSISMYKHRNWKLFRKVKPQWHKKDNLRIYDAVFFSNNFFFDRCEYLDQIIKC